MYTYAPRATAPVLLLLGCLTGAACARSAAPAAPGGPAVATTAPARDWRVTLQEADGVELDIVMTFESDGGRWSAYSRPGGARELAGAGRSLLGALSGQLPKEALIFASGQQTAGATGEVMLEGALRSPFLGNRTWRGQLAGNRLRAELTRTASGARAATITAVPHSSPAPLRDYPALATSLQSAIESTIYDPRLLDRPEYRRFFQELHARFARARDDLDAVASFQALKPALATSHLEFIRNPRLAALPLDSVLAGVSAADPAQLVRLGFPAPGVAFLRVTKWDDVGAAIDAAFVRIDSAGAPFLILDIRGNTGGDASAIVPLTYLIRDTMTVGVFAGRQWYARHGAPPRRQDFDRIRTLTSSATPADLIRELRAHGAVRGVAVPRLPNYAGTVFLLTDRGTASASEPLAHALKQERRATLIGERTAGRMLTALPQALGDGWIAIVPEADYVTADEIRLEGRGVEPHVAVSSSAVFLAVADQITASAPFSAEVLRGGSYEALQQPDDAERAYRRALEKANQQQPVPTPQQLAGAHRRLARLLATRGDTQAAAAHWREVLRHLPNDTEAAAALRREGAGP